MPRPAPPIAEAEPGARRPSGRGRLLRLTALVAVVPVTLLAAELGVRAFDWGPAPRPVISGTVLRPVADPELRFVPVPSAERVVEYPPVGDREGRRIAQRLNAQGLRGRAAPVPKPAGRLRIVCIGDSHTFGEGVTDAETWPALLEARLAARLDRTVEVVNAGVQGYDTVQEALWLEHFALDLEPDLVLLQFFMNDATQRDGIDAPAAAEAGWLLRLAHPRREGFVRDLRRGSRLVDGALEAIFRRSYFDHWGAGNSERFLASEASWERWTAAMVRIEGLLAERGVPLAVVLYPLMHADGDGLASDAVHAQVTEFLAERGIAHLDAEPAFRGRDLVALRVHPGDFHAGAEANRIFAAAVDEWLATWARFAALATQRPAPRQSPVPTSPK